MINGVRFFRPVDYFTDGRLVISRRILKSKMRLAALGWTGEAPVPTRSSLRMTNIKSYFTTGESASAGLVSSAWILASSSA
jgi:hypothetical protein